MRSVVGRDAVASFDRPAAVTIGTFDGVHVGHRALIARTIERARADNLVSVVVTWDRHPAHTLRPDKAPPLLTTPERKAELLEESGTDALVVLEFDEVLSRWAPDDFVRRILVDGLNTRAVYVGRGWRFGHRASGDENTLRLLGERLGFTSEAVDLAQVDGGPASSTRAREAIAKGDMETARAVLGRPFDLDGIVRRGDDRGRKLGWPTANLIPEPGYAHPPIGVYAGRARADGRWHAAATNIGVNPTFGGDPGVTPVRVESYLLDFDGDLYDQPLRVEFHKRLRDEERFASTDALVEQIGRDVEETRRLIGS